MGEEEIRQLCDFCDEEAVYLIEYQTYVCDNDECLALVIHEFLNVEEL